MDSKLSDIALPGERRGPPKTATQRQQVTEALEANVAQLRALAMAIEHGCACTERLVEQLKRIS